MAEALTHHEDPRSGNCYKIKLTAALLGLPLATRQYAKRQRTWFRNRMGDWPRLGLGGAPL